MSSTSSPTRTKNQFGILARINASKLKAIKVAIKRHDVRDPPYPTPQLRSIDDPSLLVIHYRSDEGQHPIFDRDDIVVNQVADVVEKRVVLSAGPREVKSSRTRTTSRSRSRSRSPTKGRPLEEKRSSAEKVKGGSRYAKEKYGTDRFKSSSRSNTYPRGGREPSPRDSSSSKYRQRSYQKRSRSKSQERPYGSHSALHRSPSPHSAHKSSTSRKYSCSPSRYDHSKSGRSPPRSERFKDEGRRDPSPGAYKRRGDKSPPRYGSPDRNRSPTGRRGEKRRSSRSPPRDVDKYKRDRGRYGSRSPPKYTGPPPEKFRRLSLSPTSRDHRRRSRSRSPYRSRRSTSRERRYSRSPHHRDPDYRRYDKSRRSRSPRRTHVRHSPEHRSSRRERSPRPPAHKEEFPSIVTPYGIFPSEEYWIPGAMPPRAFIPRVFIPPPGAFPRGIPGPAIMPRMPVMLPPRPPFRHRLPIYNSAKVIRPRVPIVTTTTTTASDAENCSSTTTVIAAVASTSAPESSEELPSVSSG